MSLLEVRQVTQRFGELAAVRDVSLSVEPGELHAIIGPNGAGKTTFFNMISGFYRPTAGSIVFDGVDVTAVAANQRVAMGMARTFQIWRAPSRSPKCSPNSPCARTCALPSRLPRGSA